MGRYLIIQININNPGKATNVEDIKNVTQSVCSANQPDKAESHVRPKAMKEVKRAYWVPV